MLKTTSIACLALFAGVAAAQNAARPDPADPKAPAPPLSHRSAFKDYQRYAEPETARWRDVNEEMGRLGGHVGHLKRDAAPPARPGAKVQPPAGHGAHK